MLVVKMSTCRPKRRLVMELFSMNHEKGERTASVNCIRLVSPKTSSCAPKLSSSVEKEWVHNWKPQRTKEWKNDRVRVMYERGNECKEIIVHVQMKERDLKPTFMSQTYGKADTARASTAWTELRLPLAPYTRHDYTDKPLPSCSTTFLDLLKNTQYHSPTHDLDLSSPCSAIPLLMYCSPNYTAIRRIQASPTNDWTLLQ